MLLRRQPLRLVGDVSYSFYLWHWPVLVIAAQYEGRVLSLTTNLLLVGAAFCLSVATYYLYENPIRHSELLTEPHAGLALWPATVSITVMAATLTTLAIQDNLSNQALAAVRTSEGARREAPRPR